MGLSRGSGDKGQGVRGVVVAAVVKVVLYTRVLDLALAQQELGMLFHASFGVSGA